MKRPLVFLTVLFCLGIWIAASLRIGFLPIYPIFFLCLAAAFVSFRRIIALEFLICFAVFFLAMSLTKNAQRLPECSVIRQMRYIEDELVAVQGSVSDEPVYKDGKMSFKLMLERIQTGNFIRSCCGTIEVRVKGKRDSGLSYADALIVTGRITQPFYRFLNSQRFNLSGNVAGIINATAVSKAVKLQNRANSGIKGFSLRLKKSFSYALESHLSPVTAAVTEAMVLGDKSRIPRIIQDTMVKCGTVHILVVSGFNVGIVAFIIMLFLKIVRLPRFFRFLSACFLLLIYAFMSGGSTPVIRAVIMAVVCLFAYFVKRDTDIYNALSIAALIILVHDPFELFDIGFQLSFVSVISIVFFYQKVKEIFRLNIFEKIRFFKFIGDSFAVSLSAWMGTAVLIAYYFKMICPVAVLINILVVPLASVITLCGFSVVIAHSVNPALANLFGYTTELAIMFLFEIHNVLLKIPGAYFYL